MILSIDFFNRLGRLYKTDRIGVARDSGIINFIAFLTRTACRRDGCFFGTEKFQFLQFVRDAIVAILRDRDIIKSRMQAQVAVDERAVFIQLRFYNLVTGLNIDFNPFLTNLFNERVKKVADGVAEACRVIEYYVVVVRGCHGLQRGLCVRADRTVVIALSVLRP